MKVMILHRNSFDKIGGVETTLYYISEELTKLGHEVVLLSQKSKNDEGNEEATDIARILKYSRPTIPKLLLPLAPFIVKNTIGSQISTLISNEKPDLIISRDNLLTVVAKEKHESCNLIYIPPVIIKLYNEKIRKSFTLKELVISIIRNFQLKIEEIYQKKAFETSNRIIVFSNNVKSQVLDIYKGKYINKLSVIYPGVGGKFSYTSKPNHEIYDEFNIPYSKKIILFVGRIVHEKNLHMLIKAFDSVQGSAVLVIVGDGSALNSLRKLVGSMDMNDKVYFTGKRRDVERFYRSATISVIPSTYEAFGNVISESLSCGTPVIGFKNTPPIVRNAVEELITNGNNGFIIKEFSELSLKESIEEALEVSNSEDYLIMRKNCREYAEKNFDWKLFVQNLF